MCVPFDAGGRPLRPRQRTARRRRPASINTPSSGGLGNFAAQRSRGMPLRGRGKFLLNGVVAKRHGPRRQVARQERLQWGEAVSPKGTHAKHVRSERATLAGRNLRHEQGRAEEYFVEIVEAASDPGVTPKLVIQNALWKRAHRRTVKPLDTSLEVTPEQQHQGCPSRRTLRIGEM
jgi:hypothetical protein